jgi:hypothetical protein
MRTRTLWLLSLLATALVVGPVVCLAGPSAPAGHHVVRREGARPMTAPEPCARRALAVLRAWDHRRARVWAAGEPAALRRLYTAGSRTAARDTAMLAGYHARGLRVRSMHRQVLALDVRTCRADRMSLVVTDRLVDAVAVGHGERTGLPPGQAQTRRLDLHRGVAGWLVSEVYER